MEVLITIISFLIIALVLFSPYGLITYLNKRNAKYLFLNYVLLGTLMGIALIAFFGWWMDTSNYILLNHYGYDMNNSNAYESVLPENIERVKELEVGSMGLGWPLKSIFGLVFYTVYILVLYPISRAVIRKLHLTSGMT